VDSRHPARVRSGPTLRLVPSAGPPPSPGERAPSAPSLRRYPLWRVLGLNGLTLLAYVAACAGILVAYRRYPVVGWPVGLSYFVFAIVQLYVFKPLVVCPGCTYRTIRDGRCPSGLNVLSGRLCPPSADPIGFRERDAGLLCQNRLSRWSWLLPVPLALPGLVLAFSWPAAALVAVVAALALVRWLVVRLTACPHCLARRWCPAIRPHAVPF
jgi:hypothetical protein